MSRYGFITGRGKDHSIPRDKTCVHFYHITNHFSGRQYQIHPVMSLRASITDIRYMEPGRMASFFINTVYGLFSQLVKMDASRMAVTIGILHQYLRFSDIFFIPSAS